eukprot:273376-Pelagomonas_calceolata.AAC.1
MPVGEIYARSMQRTGRFFKPLHQQAAWLDTERKAAALQEEDCKAPEDTLVRLSRFEARTGTVACATNAECLLVFTMGAL